MECNCKRGAAAGGFPTRYWKLACPVHTSSTSARAMMEAMNFYCPESASNARIMQLLRRAERGLTSFDRYQLAELKKFIEARGLSDGKEKYKTVKKATLIALLERVDEESVFSRFMDLPPELRLRVYEHHFASFDTVDAEPPPILGVSREIRKEARPLFYESARLFIRSRDQPRSHGAYSEYSSIPTLSRCGLCQKLFDELDIGCLSSIRHLTLQYMWSGTNYFDIDLAALNDKDMVKMADFEHGRHVHLADTEMQCFARLDAAALRELLKITKGIAARPGKGKMRREDLMAFASESMRDAINSKEDSDDEDRSEEE